MPIPAQMSSGNHSRASSVYQVSDYPEPDPPNPEEIAYERRKLRKRILILALSSIILVSMVCIISVSGVFSGNSSTDHTGPNNASITNPSTDPQAKVNALCTVTEFKNLCISSISKYAIDDTSDDPNSLLSFSLQAAIDAVTKAYNYSSLINPNSLESRTKWAFSDCKELLQYALNELQTTYEDVTDAELKYMPVQREDRLSGLSSSITFQQTCLDGFSNGTEKNTVEMIDTLKNATETTRNSLAIFSVVMLTKVDEEAEKLLRRDPKRIEGAMEHMNWFMAKGNPDVVVAQDGSGDYKTITEALNAVPKPRDDRFVIYVKEGLYKENVKVTDEMEYVLMYGDGADKTVVTGNKGFGDGSSLYGTATFAVSGLAFMAKNMGFQNTAGPLKGGAIALRIESDMSVFYNCHIDGYQNSLYAHARRQFYRNCNISGTLDIISGDAATILQNCNILVKKPLPSQQNIVTAHNRIDIHSTTGFIIENCTIAAAGDLFPMRLQIPTYMGRPVKDYSRVVIIQSKLDDLVRPEGWAPPTNGSSWLMESVFFAEYENRGPGANLNKRVNWSGFHILRDMAKISEFTAGEFINGISWLNMTGVPFYTGLIDNPT